MNKIIISLFILLVSLDVNAESVCQSESTFENINLVMCSRGPWESSSHPIKRMPGVVVMPPLVQFCPETMVLRFTGVEDFSTFTYYILDESENVLLSEELSLFNEQEETISLIPMTRGTYTIIIYIGGHFYEAMLPV